MIERTVYECEHCHKKRLVSKYAMRDHEKECLMKQDLRFKLKTNCLYWKQKEINEEEF